MKVESYSLGLLMTNAYLVYKMESKRGIIIDPGENPQVLIQRIEALQLNIEAILLTHAHFDHIAGLNEVRKITKAPVYLHEKESDWLNLPEKNGSKNWPGVSPVVCEPAEVLLKGEEQLSFLGESFRVLHTPGHSPGSVTFQHDSSLFGGDVLFAGGIGRTDLPGGSYEELMKTIQTKLLILPDHTIVRPGHGPETTIGIEKEQNPFIIN